MNRQIEIGSAKKHRGIADIEGFVDAGIFRMKGVVAKMPENEIDQIKNQFINKLSPMKIYLFGSFANGTANEDSDFDFYIVVKDGTENLMDLTVEAYKSIRSIRNRAVDIVIGTESRFETRKHKLSLENEVMSEGILLFCSCSIR